ncbi:hypothetical protein [Bartonella grahamii]|uniref:hypothetical protein n=1 Tax=Bartonella grahamii TaxID=33045 RepID=UPI0037CC537C
MNRLEGGVRGGGVKGGCVKDRWGGDRAWYVYLVKCCRLRGGDLKCVGVFDILTNNVDRCAVA